MYILTWKCVLRRNGAHFFDIWTSKSARAWSVFSILTSKRASRHNGPQFFISHLPRWLRTRRFSEPTFRPSGTTNHWEYRVFATFLPFRAPASSFFWLFLFSDLLSSLPLFSDSSHLCFSICPYCRKFDFETSLDNSHWCIPLYIYIYTCTLCSIFPTLIGFLPPRHAASREDPTIFGQGAGVWQHRSKGNHGWGLLGT